MEEKIEIRVDNGDFERIKSRIKRGDYLKDIPALERTLLLLRYRYLSEKVADLEKRLGEMKEHWNSLLEFERMAREDKEFMMEFRRALSEENHRLEEKVRNVEDSD